MSMSMRVRSRLGGNWRSLEVIVTISTGLGYHSCASCRFRACPFVVSQLYTTITVNTMYLKYDSKHHGVIRDFSGSTIPPDMHFVRCDGGFIIVVLACFRHSSLVSHRSRHPRFHRLHSVGIMSS
jgi:hypothetical protein